MVKMLRIGIVGAESCGKTTLALSLAQQLHGTFVGEYARDYVGQLSAPYTYNDVVHIARKQCEELSADYPTKWVFYDTELIITKVWFMHKYGCCPAFVTEMLRSYPLDFVLLCACDLPFVPDPLRENPAIRPQLTAWYREELEEYGIPFSVVSGIGDARLQSALHALKRFD